MTKKTLILLIATLISLNVSAQKAGISTPISVNIVKEVIPAILDIEPNSIQFIDESGNNAIDALEHCYIKFIIRNSGKGEGIGCRAILTAKGTTEGISYKSKELPKIAPNSTQIVELPLISNMNTKEGIITFNFHVTEPQGFGTDPNELTVATKAFVSPMVKIVDYSVTSASGNSQLQKKSPFNLQLMLQNTAYGKAEDINVQVSFPDGVYVMDGAENTSFSTLDAGMAKSLEYQLIVANNYSASTIPIKISLSEKYGKYAEDKIITLQINQMLASTKITLDEIQQQRNDIKIAVIGSSVDRNIPVASAINKNTFAVIIANENYKSVATVPYALNDGLQFREYCNKTLGIPEKNIKYIANATGNEIKAQVQWLETITNVFENPNIIFYYAGHGIPDESSKTAYLLPVDGISTDVTTGYKLDNLYSALGQMPAARTMVFLDACFSGSKREEGMLASARGVAIKAKSGMPQGNMVVFSAAQGDETAYPNNDEGHGMFTYYLLKKLQETKGDVTLYDLGNYITKNVSQQSILLNGKSQTPSVTAAAILGTDWQYWKLK